MAGVAAALDVFALWMCSRARADSRGARAVESLAVALAASALFLTAAEGSLRLLGFGEREARFGRSLEIVLRPHERGVEGGMPYQLNAYGLRDDEFPVARPARELRVLCLGDSSTFGFRVDPERSYPQVLERLLSVRTGRPTQVVNAGVVGASSYQGRDLAARFVPAFDPEVVVVAFGHNDRWLRPLPDARGGTGKALALVMQSRVTCLLGRLCSRLLPPRQDRFVPRVSASEFGQNLEAMAEVAARHRARAILLFLPDNPLFPEGIVRARAAMEQGRWQEAYEGLVPVTRLSALNPDPEAYDLLARAAERLGRPRIEAQARHDAELRRRLAPRLPDEEAYRRAFEMAAARSGARALVISASRARGHQLDVCHPDAVLHGIIAEELAAVILGDEAAER